MIYDRPFLTYKQQVERLRDEYNLIIQNDTFAIHALSTMSYYDLVNAYQDIFIIDGKFVDGTTIEFLYEFYIFDNTLQNILIKQSFFIENIFKTRFAYIISKNHGVHQDSYLDETHYLPMHPRDKNLIFSQIKNNIEQIYNPKQTWYNIPQPTKHYKNNRNHIPPWILFKNISFANSISLYRLLRHDDQKEVTNSMIPSDNVTLGVKIDFLINSLNIIRDFRNKIAHNLRFIAHKPSNKLGPNVIKKLSPPHIYTNKDVQNKLGVNDIYGQILSIIILLDNPFLIVEFLKEILQHISFYGNDNVSEDQVNIKNNIFMNYCQATNLPVNLVDRIVNLINYYS